MWYKLKKILKRMEVMSAMEIMYNLKAQYTYKIGDWSSLGHPLILISKLILATIPYEIITSIPWG